MSRLSLGTKVLMLITALSMTLVSTISAADFTEFPKLTWSTTVPANTTTDDFAHKPIEDQYLPIVSTKDNTAYMLLRHKAGNKSTYQMMAVNDVTGKQKWVHTSPYRYNPYNIDANGNAYYVEDVKVGNKHGSKLIALDANMKPRWEKVFPDGGNFEVLSDGRYAVIDFVKEQNLLKLYSPEGKEILSRLYNGNIRHIQGDYVGTANYEENATVITIYSISRNKKVTSYEWPKEYFSPYHNDFDVLSGGTILVPLIDEKTGMETLQGISPTGKKKWTRSLPTPVPNSTLFQSIGNHFLIQEENTLSVYDTNNKQISTRTFDDLPELGKLQFLNKDTFVFGAVEDKGLVPVKLIEQGFTHNDYVTLPSKAVYHVLDRTLSSINALKLDQAPFSAENIRFVNANTFYLTMEKTLAKYELTGK
ncbi:hypothetical protein MH215_23180 [Paenibacillus sp. ACRSA]|uniref:hypothetical protein n=1 Tax=Paenibacillus sp. ACRSA TaxID=2918211 RepID=UPI001EF66FC8|nr:hypothetical protein [Paenibacillus sp. ACRSA]MCG7379909.1 hypothetical protein [Paenibacillus sp. ACRSA]